MNKIWEEVHENLFTPGGDPVWQCPICKGGRHVYGVENADEVHDECPDCHTKLIYPWMNKGILISNNPEFFAYSAYESGWSEMAQKELRDKYMVFYHNGLYGVRLIPIRNERDEHKTYDTRWAKIQFLIEDDGFLKTTNNTFNTKYADEICELIQEAKEYWETLKEKKDDSI